MTRSQRLAFETIRAIVRASGCAATFEHGRKHAHVVVSAPNGRLAKLTLAGSPRSGAAEVKNWSRQDAQQALRRLGVSASQAVA